MNAHGPLVSIVTPVYNGEKYLAECIESVLAQTYRHWDYTIVNNCSTDGSLEIAESYARKDSRIRVLTNTSFVGAVENYNNCFSQISPHSTYCKVVSADDWLLPDCLDEMVRLGEAHPTVAIIGCYQQSAENVRWKGLPVETDAISGKEVCRASLLHNLDVFGSSTSVMHRSDLVRQNTPFYPHTLPHADTSSCFKYLQSHDFGFVHKILCVERVHSHQWSSGASRMGTGNIAGLELLLTYGPLYLNTREFEARKGEVLSNYYRWLGGSVLKLHGAEFWKYHTAMLRELGYPIQWTRVARATVEEIAEELRKPSIAFAKLSEVIKQKYKNRHGKILKMTSPPERV
jgi:glycosyltransferase involved in cell wall biosynthesis